MFSDIIVSRIKANSNEMSSNNLVSSTGENTKSTSSKRSLKSNKRTKYRHSHGDACSFFRCFYVGYILRIVGGLLGLGVGTMLLVAGSWINSGFFAFLGITQGTWPRYVYVPYVNILKSTFN